jgi:Tfp pilus assembly protein PilF
MEAGMGVCGRLLILGAILLSVVACASMRSDSERQDSGQGNYAIGLGALMENNLAKAILSLREAVVDEPDNPRYHHALGNAYLRSEQLEPAILAFRRAVELDPRFSDALSDLGVAYMQQRRWDLAVDAFRRALANPRYLNPERAYLNLGNTYMAQSRYDLAEQEFRRVTDVVPLSPDGYFFLGRALASQGKFPEAKEQLARAITLDGTIPVFHLELGVVQMRLKEIPAAKASFQRVQDFNPRGPEASDARKYLQELR